MSAPTAAKPAVQPAARNQLVVAPCLLGATRVASATMLPMHARADAALMVRLEYGLPLHRRKRDGAVRTHGRGA